MRRIGQQSTVRRARFEKSVGEERWLVSYADFITLLFAFFVVMYSVSQVNESKYRSLSETLNAAFSRSSSAGQAQEQTSRIADLTDIQQSLTEKLSGYPIEGDLQLSANEQWVELSLSSEMLFSSASAVPNAQASGLFGELAEALSDIENEIQIIGHTDNIPISNDEFRNNWALSSARAVAVVNALAFQGIAPERLSATGFGEYRPIADNATEQGRSQNRRVVVRVGNAAAVPEKQSAEISPATSDLNNLDDSPTLLDTSIESDSSGNLTPSPANEGQTLPNGIQPLRLKGGDLLFTSDPDLPRTRELEE